jgi:site-specific DNA-cytosine methylase
MFEAIEQIRPTWVVGENVFGIINWSDGMVFHEIISDLESLGFEVQTYIIPACAVDSPHRRERTFLLPTPSLMDIRTDIRKPKERSKKANKGGCSNLREFVINSMLPTPASTDYKGANSLEALNKRRRNPIKNSLRDYFAQTGKTSQLNPLFVGEMMGFPKDYLVLPFQRIVRNHLKHTEMQ